MSFTIDQSGIGLSSFLDLLIATRNLYGSGGNRRRLFNRFDEILSAQIDWAGVVWNPTLTQTAHPFRFRRIALRNWKAFEQAEFDLSAPVDQPVALIGGNNGNGKTSILDAIAVGLYGVHAHIDRSRLNHDAGERSASRRSGYHQAVARAMHRQAFERGDRDMSVVIEVDCKGEPFEIERHWYLGDDGSFSEEDEELVLRIGADRHILSPPADVHSAEFAFFEIERRIAPASMLPFLLFDGEQIRRLAQQELSEQVRFGLESALGVSVVKALLEDLTDYARDRGKNVQANTLEVSLSAQLAAFEAELSDARAELEKAEARLEPLRKRRDKTVKSMGSIGDGTYQDRHVEFEQRNKLQADLQIARHELLVSGVRLLPFLLIPADLLQKLDGALDRGARATALSPGQDKRMLRELLTAMAKTKPPLSSDDLADLTRRTKEAWSYSVGSEDASKELRFHAYLVGHDARRVREMAASSRTTASSDIDAMLRRILELTSSLAHMDDNETKRSRAEASRIELVAELEQVSQEIVEIEQHRRRLDLVSAKLEAQIEPLRRDLIRRRVQRRGAGHAAVGAEAARALVQALSGSIEVAMPAHYEALAKTLTDNYRRLAHKEVVQSVLIHPDGTVALLDAFDRDLRDTDASAGEDQIFAMALITSISGIGGTALPLVIDTPLGRLDTAHRDRVLDYLASRSSQTILLSQPEEVTGRYYDRIAPRVGSEYHLLYRSEGGGLGKTLVQKGYFPGLAA